MACGGDENKVVKQRSDYGCVRATQRGGRRCVKFRAGSQNAVDELGACESPALTFVLVHALKLCVRSVLPQRFALCVNLDARDDESRMGVHREQRQDVV